MSNALAIAAVTTTLHSLLERLLGVNVTTKPLDQARRTTDDQLNLFLYHTAFNGALSNMPMPNRARPGETGQPPLALNLYYLVTAYGRNDNDSFAHQLLGQAMGLLHDHPLLDPEEIRDATLADLPTSDLHLQVERVRITPQPMMLEEMSKLWTTFQTQYRISAAYQVAVVLIESTRPVKTPLPVLARGSDTDSGISTETDMVPPFPTITSAFPSSGQFSALLGGIVTLSGHHLDGTNVRVNINQTRLDIRRSITTVETHTPTEISFRVPNEPANLPAGIYTVTVEITRPGETFSRTTNRLAFSLAPEITPPPTVPRAANGDVTINLNCRPDVRPEQTVALLLGDREILAQPHPVRTGSLTFNFTNPTPAQAPDPVEYSVRLRVDGVDSLLLDRTGPVAVFRSDQKVTIT